MLANPEKDNIDATMNERTRIVLIYKNKINNTVKEIRKLNAVGKADTLECEQKIDDIFTYLSSIGCLYEPPRSGHIQELVSVHASLLHSLRQFDGGSGEGLEVWLRKVESIVFPNDKDTSWKSAFVEASLIQGKIKAIFQR